MSKGRISDRTALLSVMAAMAVIGGLAVAPAAPAFAKPGATQATVQFTSATFTATENGGTALVGVIRNSTAGDAQVRLVITGGTASEGVDYTGWKKGVFKVAFAPGQAVATVAIPLLDDTLFEGPETVGLALDGSMVNVAPGAIVNATLAIVDDEFATVSVAGGPAVEEGGAVTFTLNVATSPGTTARVIPVSVDWSLTYGTAGVGDFTVPTNGTAVIPMAATTATVPVMTSDDVLDEADVESFDLVLSHPSPGVVLGSGAPGAIIDNDGPRCPNDDAFEDNDDAEHAAPVTFGTTLAGILCPDDSDLNGRLSDFYRFDAFIGRTVDVRVQFLHAQGDINLILRGPDGTVRWSRGTGNAEQITFQVAPGGPGRYDLQVYESSDAGVFTGTSYSLALAGFTCAGGDPFEEDDEAATAGVLASGSTVEGILCPNDSDANGRTSDFFAFDVVGGQTADIRVGFFHAEGDINLMLWSPDGTPVAWSRGTVDNEQIIWTAAGVAGGRYALQAYLAEDLGTVPGNAYSVTVAIS